MGLNFNTYSAKATYIETNRVRTIKEIKAFDEEEVKSYLIENGFKEPFEIKQIPHEGPTENQISYAKDLKIKITEDMTKLDLSYLIDKTIEHEQDANPELIEYATDCKIKLSTYIGKKSLYDYIWNTLTGTDKIAFFVFCIYRWLSEDRLGNLNKSPHKDLFFSFAEQHINDKSFLNSMNRYKGRDLRYFGNQQYKSATKEYKRYGGNENTVAYKSAATFLLENGLVSKIHRKVNFADIEQSEKKTKNKKRKTENKEQPKTINKKSKKISVIFFGILSILFWLLHVPKIITIIVVVLFICILITPTDGENTKKEDFVISDNDLLTLNTLYNDYEDDTIELIKAFKNETNHSLSDSKKIVDYYLEHTE